MASRRLWMGQTGGRQKRTPLAFARARRLFTGEDQLPLELGQAAERCRHKPTAWGHQAA
jgi:hypothetical protein